jgi:hypothetical protein
LQFYALKIDERLYSEKEWERLAERGISFRAEQVEAFNACFKGRFFIEN